MHLSFNECGWPYEVCFMFVFLWNIVMCIRKVIVHEVEFFCERGSHIVVLGVKQLGGGIPPQLALRLKKE
jgi:hypothetical protein